MIISGPDCNKFKNCLKLFKNFYIQIYPVRFATCNLHGKSNKAGITAVVPHFSLKQYIMSVPVTQDYHSGPHNWLEAGGFALGPLHVDAGMALPTPEFHGIQDRFLKLHDKKTHRLWFLWPTTHEKSAGAPAGKCGCVGGCTFFGLNRNGPKFYNPCENDFGKSLSAAAFHICVDGNMGYGQSLLHPNQFMFESELDCFNAHPRHPPYEQTLIGMKRGSDTPNTSTTLIDSAGYNSDISSESRAEIFKMELDGISSQGSTLKPPSAQYRDSSREPSDVFIQEEDNQDKDIDHLSSSLSSLPEIVHRRRINDEPKLTGSYDSQRIPLKSPSRESGGSSSAYGSPITRQSSRGSNPSSSTFSRNSSLTSPILRRLTSLQSISRSSLASIPGSEFHSAAEDFVDATSSPPSTTHSRMLHSRKSESRSPPANKMGLLQRGSPASREGDETIIKQSGTHKSSDSESISSFMSAVSSQEIGMGTDTEFLTKEDLVNSTAANYVDLHGQINQPITQSPLLMSCYSSHLTHLQCQQWNSVPPFPHLRFVKLLFIFCMFYVEAY